MRYNEKEQAANRKVWVEALRSGEYEQGTGQLRKDNAYCCLGVACDVSGLGEWHSRLQNHNYTYKIHEDKSDFTYLPYEVRAWLGISTSDGELTNHNSLASMNDDGATFIEIADAIEEHGFRTY